MHQQTGTDRGFQQVRDLALVLIGALLTALVVGILRPVIEGLERELLKFVLEALSPFPLLVKTLAVLIPTVAIVYLVCMVAFYLNRLTQVLPPTEVTLPPRLKFSWLDWIFLYAVFQSSVRIIIASGLVMGILITLITSSSLPTILLSLLVVLVVLNTVREFATRHGGIKEAVEYLVDQLLFALGAQIELAIKEALGAEDYRLRCQIMLLDPQEQRLELKHGYHMAGEPDWDLPLGPNQCVRGLAFSQSKPMLRNPYDPENLGLDESQLAKLPQISWMAAFPLLFRGEHKSFGVLSVDCNHPVAQEWLDKILDFTHAMSSSIAIVYNIKYNGQRAL